jgi:3-oxoacyl-[acyl-carrier protein] reductase
MNLGIEGRTAFVGAAGGGLGSAIARALANEGARVVVADIDAAGAAATAERISQEGGEALPLTLDIGDLTSFPDALSRIGERFDAVDILVNLTGGPPPTPAAGNTPDLWVQHFHSMVLGVIHLTDLVLPSMRERGWGRIVTSASSGVVTPIPNLSISNALRLSLLGWSKTLAGEVAADGVTVNVVVPGRIATRRIEALDAARAEREGVSFEDVVRQSTSSIATKRYGRPEEYAAAVAFLASEPASYLTGATVRVDGGLIPSI